MCIQYNTLLLLQKISQLETLNAALNEEKTTLAASFKSIKENVSHVLYIHFSLVSSLYTYIGSIWVFSLQVIRVHYVGVLARTEVAFLHDNMD